MAIFLAIPFSEFTDEQKEKTKQDRYYTEISDDPCVFNQEQDALETIIKPKIIEYHKRVKAFRDALLKNKCATQLELQCNGKGNCTEGLGI